MTSSSVLIERTASITSDLFSGLISRLTIALVLLLLGFIVGKSVGRIVGKILHELEIDESLKRRGFTMPVEQTTATILSYVTYAVSVLLVINHLGLTEGVVRIVIGGAVVLVIISTVLGIKDFIPNFIAGVVLYRKKLFSDGDYISVGDMGGRVRRITVIETEIETKAGDVIHIPNSLLMKKQVKVKKRPTRDNPISRAKAFIE